MKTKYPCVYQDKNGRFSYLVELGTDQVTGKRIQKKGTKDSLGKRFSSAREAHKEVMRIKNEYMVVNGFANYDLTYKEFMEQSYVPHYKASVQKSTWSSRECGLIQITEFFGDKKLREINVRDCENYRIWLLNDSGYSQAYSSLMYGMFRKSLDYAVTLQFLNENISKRTKAIPKGKSMFLTGQKKNLKKFWQKFIKMISTNICVF